MPRRQKPKSNSSQLDPREALRNLIQKARNFADKDIWNHSLVQKKNKHNIRATEKEEDEKLIHEAELSNTHSVYLHKQPSLIRNGSLRSYQLEGVSWLVNLRSAGLNGILADEMGLGKTLQCIALLAYIREHENIDGPHLILVPKSTIQNWCRECTKWCPSFNVLALEAANKEERKGIITKNFRPHSMDIIICSYEIAMIEKNVLKKINYEYIIVDEAHRLKNNDSKLSKILRTEFTSAHKLLITGTPMQNKLTELWSLLHFLLPNLFNSSEDFDAMFDFETSDDEQEKIFKQLRVLLQPFLLRRLKSNVCKDLPPKTELVIFTGMTDLQRDIYKKLLLKEMTVMQSSDGGSKRALLNLVMQLRKCANHPYLFDGVEDRSLDPYGQHLIDNCGKLLLLDKLLKKLFAAQSRVLIFSQMTRVLDILEDYCAIKQYKHCRIDGSTSGEDRQTAMDGFNAKGSDTFLFLLTTRAGGLGINLQSADIVIIYDSDWNPQMDLQAMDRAHRIGQTKPVFVYRLVTKDSVEQRILERAELKLRLGAMVIQKKNKNNLNKNSLMEMITYGADKIFKAKGSVITDDDIDTILSVSESETAKLKQGWQEKIKKSFNELSIDFNYCEYEGQDYSLARKARVAQIEQARYKLLATLNDADSQSGRAHWTRLSMVSSNDGKPLVHTKYHLSRVNALANKNTNNNTNGLSVPSPLPDCKYWELYDIKSLSEMYIIEWEFFQKYKNADFYDSAVHKPLSEEQIKLKKDLLSEGFPMFSFSHFRSFVRHVTQNGKDQIDLICEGVKEETELDDEILRKYYARFFECAEKCEELNEVLARIQVNEEKLGLRKAKEARREARKAEKEAKEREKREKMENVLRKWKEEVSADDCIYKNISISDYKNGESDSEKAINRYLFQITAKIGYGNWDKIYQCLRAHESYRYNFELMTMYPKHIKHRIDTILRKKISKRMEISIEPPKKKRKYSKKKKYNTR